MAGHARAVDSPRVINIEDLRRLAQRRVPTSGAGAFLRRLDRVGPAIGTITVGSRADLLLLDANPLTDISNVRRIAGVVVRGHWYTRGRIDAIRLEPS